MAWIKQFWLLFRLENQTKGNETMENQKYNGWTNYATWRVNVEFFDGWHREEGEDVSPDYLQDIVEEGIAIETNGEGFAAGYANAFLSEVNWHEIAEHINSED
jgi:hypothetical protein